MTTLTAETPFLVLDPVEASDDDTLDHAICDCYPDVALCGLDVSDFPYVEIEEENQCIVCIELEKLPCPRCGEMP